MAMCYARSSFATNLNGRTRRATRLSPQHKTRYNGAWRWLAVFAASKKRRSEYLRRREKKSYLSFFFFLFFLFFFSPSFEHDDLR